jgi:PAS domain S-box-containing protein
MLATATHWLFDPGGLTAHGFCLLWEPWLLWTHAGADATIGFAYLTIPLALTVYARRRADLAYQPVLWLFAAFILLCGVGHWLELLTLWVPAYRLEGLVKLATAAVSVMTAIMVWALMPAALALPTPRQLRQANAALREREAQISSITRSLEQLRNMVEASPTALVLADAGGCIRMVNRKAEEMFGYERSALQGQPLETLMPERFRRGHHGLREGFQRNRSSRVMGEGRSLYGQRRDGVTFPLEVALNPIDLDGERMVLCGVNDITARCEAERAVQERQHALEQSNADLVVARSRAEKATLAKSRFLARMSHELRTPLNGILGYAQLLGMDGGLSPEQAARVERMRGAGQHLLEMINKVLDLSEVEADRVELHMAIINVRELAQECVALFRPGAEAKGLVLRDEVSADVSNYIIADRTRLRQVLLNLLANAVKFTDQGYVALRLSMMPPAHAHAEPRLLIEVVDTGRGIQAERRDDLFQDFERLGIETQEAIEGSGLGLAISARLVALMGGRIVHADHPGGGSVFSFDLAPSGAVAAGTRYVPLSPAPAAPPVSADGPTLRVLVVDDVAMNRDIAESFLRAAGHEAVCADGGEAAILAAAAEDFDAVLMDLRMPGVDGFEAMRRLRAIGGKRGRVPVIALTAHAFAAQVEECREAGMAGHVAKPFTQAALLAALRRVHQDKWPSQDGEAGSQLMTPVIDLDVFNATTGMLPRVKVTTYLQGIAGSMEALLRSFRARDPGAPFGIDIADAVHTLAGSAGMIGFSRVSTLGRRFSHAARIGDESAFGMVAGLTAALELSLQEAMVRLSFARNAVAEEARAESAPAMGAAAQH